MKYESVSQSHACQVSWLCRPTGIQEIAGSMEPPSTNIFHRLCHEVIAKGIRSLLLTPVGYLSVTDETMGT